jgi:hypothetical protein
MRTPSDGPIRLLGKSVVRLPASSVRNGASPHPSEAQCPPTVPAAVRRAGRNTGPPEAFLLPCDDCPRRYEYQEILPAGPQPGVPGPEQAIGRPAPRVRDGLFAYGELMPECKMFQAQRCLGSELCGDESQQDSHNGWQHRDLPGNFKGAKVH